METSTSQTTLPLRSEFMQFLAIAGVLMICWFLLNTTTFLEVQSARFAAFIAMFSGAVAGIFSDGVEVLGTVITGESFAVDIRYGCDALEPMALFTAVVVAYRSPLSHKLKGLPVGLLTIFVINQVRIFSLMVAQQRFPSLFDILHVDIWQPLFVVIALGIFAGWLGWSNRQVITNGVVENDAE